MPTSVSQRGWTKSDKDRYEREYARCRKKQKRGKKACERNALALVKRMRVFARQARDRRYRRQRRVRSTSGACDCET